MEMTKLIRLLTLSAILVVILAACTLNASTPAVSNVVLTLTITANPSTYDQAGQQITYTYVIKNSGTNNLGPAQFTVNDNLTGSINCGDANTTLTPDTTVTCTATYTISEADLTVGSIINNATASGGGAGPSPSASATISKGTSALLTLTTAANPLTYDQAGQTITYTYVILNTGAASLGPAQFTVSDNLVGSINCGDANKILAPNEMVTCTATYTISQDDLAVGSIINSATASGGGAAPSASASATINKAATASLTLTTTANPATYNQAGQQITYTYVIKNSGTNNLGPAQFTVSDNLTGSINCGDANTTLTPDTTVTCTATYAISQADLNVGSIVNSATASGGGAGPSQSASATITKSPLVGDLTRGSTYKHTVERGEWLWQIARCYGANPIAVRDANQPNPGRIFQGTIVTVPNIGSEGEIHGKPCIEKYTVQSGDTWASIAQKKNVDVTVLKMANSNTLTVGHEIVIPLYSAGIVVPTKALTLTITPNPATYSQAGQQITYTYVIKNTGNATLGPAQFTVSDNLIGPFNCGPGNTTLAPNATVTCTATYTISEADLTVSSIINSASASGGGAGPSQSASATISKATTVMLSLNIAPNPSTYSQAGQTITYTYVIQNTGNSTLGPAQFTVSDNMVGSINCGDANTNLAPNATVTCTATYTISEADLTVGSIINSATASGGGAGPSPSASATITKQ